MPRASRHFVDLEEGGADFNIMLQKVSRNSYTDKQKTDSTSGENEMNTDGTVYT